MTDKEIMHEYILARDRAHQHAGSELGDLWAACRDNWFAQLSDAAKLMVIVQAPDENIGL